MPLHIVDHPLVRHKLGLLREDSLSVRDFRAVANELCRLLAYEATRYLVTETTTVQGWAGPVEVQRIQGKKITAVPILRAGLGMLDGFLDILPGARVSIVGMFRDEESLEPVRYYVKLADQLEDRMAVVLDPMLATGGTCLETVSLLKEAGCANVSGLFLVAAPQGVKRVLDAHPEMDIFTAALDQGLDEKGYILPGLGDAGDKLLGTK